MRIGYLCLAKRSGDKARNGATGLSRARRTRRRHPPPIQSGHSHRSSQAQNSCPLERSAGTNPRRQTLGGALRRNLRRSSLQVAKALRPLMLTGMFRRKIASNRPTRNGIKFPAYVLFSEKSPTKSVLTQFSKKDGVVRPAPLPHICADPDTSPPLFCKHKTYIIRFYGTY